RTVIVGFSDEYGSWKTTWTRLRNRRRADAPPSTIDVPSKRMSPDVGRSSCNRSRPSVLLPDPLSPTTPSVSPRAIESDTSSTATSVSRGLRATARVTLLPTRNSFVSPRLSTSGVDMSGKLEEPGEVRAVVLGEVERRGRAGEKDGRRRAVSEDRAVAGRDDADRHPVFVIAGVVRRVPVADGDDVPDPQPVER